MRQCKICKEVKCWFQFHTEFMGLYTEVFNICKKCAKKLKNKAVREYIINNSNKRVNAGSKQKIPPTLDTLS